jgi:hypothetical protein
MTCSGVNIAFRKVYTLLEGSKKARAREHCKRERRMAYGQLAYALQKVWERKQEE